MEDKHIEKKDSEKVMEKTLVVLLVLGLALTVFNQFQILSLKSGNNGELATGMTIVQAAVIPTGTPEIYGQELQIRYSDVTPNNPELADQTISVLGNLDRSITLEGENLKRYIAIASQISCEYCCCAGSIIVTEKDVADLNAKIEQAISTGKITREQAEEYRKSAGTAACGCAHSFAMRGLAKYLISKHGSEFTDEQILDEMAKWKTLFFPTQMAAKADVMKQQGIEFSYANLGSNRYRGIEQGNAGSGMVGGC